MKKYINIYASSFISFMFFYILLLPSDDRTHASGYDIMFRKVESFSGNGVIFARITFFLLLIIVILNIIKLVQMLSYNSNYKTYHFISNILLMIFSVLYFLLPTMDINTKITNNMFSIYSFIFGIGTLLISFATLSSD